MGDIALRSAASTHVGMTRERNEDDYYAGANVFGVADGLGGHQAGEIASKLAIQHLREIDSRERRLADALEESFRKANRAIHDRAAKDPRTKGMGTTLTAIAVEDSSAHLAHVGDSRCYLLRDGEISQLSRDHTLVARMVADGKITPQQAESHPQRSILTRALGADDEIDVDTLEITLAPGDRLLLCSDGLSSVVPEEEILRRLREANDLDGLCTALVDEANQRGGPDNVTVLVVEVPVDAELARLPGPPRQAPAGTRRRVSRRALAWLAAIAIVMGGGAAGFRAWVNHSWYVGVTGDRVAIFRGLPTDFAGVSLHSQVELTGLRIADVPDFYRPRLREGIRVPSLLAARQFVAETIPRGAPGSSPSPSPSPRPTGSPT
jgi:protein phosphatase